MNSRRINEQRGHNVADRRSSFFKTVKTMRIFLILVLLLVSLLAKTTAYPQWSEEANVCFDGKLAFKRQYVQRSGRSCQAYCEREPNCIVGRYVLGKGLCYFYDTREREKIKGCPKWGYAYYRVPEIKWIEHRDGCYSTKSYKQRIPIEEKEKECKNFCAVESRCVTARFHPDTEKCYLASNNEIEVLEKCWIKNVVYEKDIDECSIKKDICGKTENCINTFGSYKCVCKKDHIRDGKNCTYVDVDECATKKHPCGKTAKCINTVGSYQCKCKKGYQYSRHGKTCKKDKRKQQKDMKLSPESGQSGKSSANPIHNFDHMTTFLGVLLACLLRQVYK